MANTPLTRNAISYILNIHCTECIIPMDWSHALFLSVLLQLTTFCKRFPHPSHCN